MKRSNTWYALILIASALLLSAVRNASADSPKPTPRATPQSHREAATEEERSSAPSTSEAERHDRREETLENRLVCLTAILAIVEVFTLFIFIGTMIANVKAANATKVAAEAAKKSAESYGKSLALQARPQLRVRQAHLIGERPYIKAGYVLVNVGGSVARIISLNHALAIGSAPPQMFGIGEPFDLVPGQKYVATVQASGSLLRDQTPTSLRLSGLVIYSDEAGIIRETSFDRPYRFDLHIFERVPNWDSEYED